MTEVKIENIVYHLDLNELSASAVSFDKASKDIFFQQRLITKVAYLKLQASKKILVRAKIKSKQFHFLQTPKFLY